MAKTLGLSSNRCSFLGRVMGKPEINDEWARMYFKTIVPENINGQWVETECIVPLMTNNPKTINTIQNFVQDERQLLVEGFAKGWQDANGVFNCGIMITTIKLGSKIMYDPDANQQANPQGVQQGNNQMSGFPSNN